MSRSQLWLTLSLGGREQPGAGRATACGSWWRAPVLRRMVRDALERACVMAAGQEQENILPIREDGQGRRRGWPGGVGR